LAPGSPQDGVNLILDLDLDLDLVLDLDDVSRSRKTPSYGTKTRVRPGTVAGRRGDGDVGYRGGIKEDGACAGS